MSDFAPYFNSAPHTAGSFHSNPNPKADDLAYGLDELEYSKQPYDYYSLSHGVNGVLAPHPDQFDTELDSELAAFGAELSLLPVETGNGDFFNFLRSDTPTCGPPSTITVSSESVSGYDSGYADSVSGRSESFYNFSAQSPTQNYAASNYSFTHELDMDFKRMGLPASGDEQSHGTSAGSYAGMPSSPSVPSIRSSPGSAGSNIAVPSIAQFTSHSHSHGHASYSPRGSFSDYEPAQPQQVRIGSSAASDYYPQAQVAQVHKHFSYQSSAGVSTVSPNNVTPQLPAVPPIPIVGSASIPKREDMQDPKKKYQCPSCPRAFARAYNLKTHIQTHDPNRSKPYACHHKSCGRSFSRKHDLTRHLVSIHRAETMSSVSASNRAIGVDKASRSWCDNCGKGWIGKGKDKGCDCDHVK
ncbi:hypothetical protein WOLCODRAFT_135083 [Wolfiporia cocos MD-104 SS10]|uniref:C2H2-type domain-containing protein n=1 Tax=Wolfiporia cocos (strain MD-104) TaxID=742152 RepID=A0A2H3ITQ3_WOLCO|nr:hypothetical protein WOLCODRAFT_135083 [Wolfiporia cocos MD-104 SS10]